MAAYLVAMIQIRDQETYKKYTDRTPDIVAKYGGRFLVRGGPVETLEGDPFQDRLVVIEFPSMDAARNMYRSDEYAEAMTFRLASSEAAFLLAPGVVETPAAPDDPAARLP